MIYTSLFDDTTCKATNQFILNQEGNIRITKKWRNINQKVYVVEGNDTLGKMKDLEFFSQDLFTSANMGDIVIKKRLDSNYYLYKRDLTIRYLSNCSSYRVDTFSKKSFFNGNHR